MNENTTIQTEALQCWFAEENMNSSYVTKTQQYKLKHSRDALHLTQFSGEMKMERANQTTIGAGHSIFRSNLERELTSICAKFHVFLPHHVSFFIHQ